MSSLKESPLIQSLLNGTYVFDMEAITGEISTILDDSFLASWDHFNKLTEMFSNLYSMKPFQNMLTLIELIKLKDYVKF